MSEILNIRNLSKSFGRKKVLENFSMSLKKGKVYGLLGINGAGKTTLIRMIMGVIPPDGGEIFYKNNKIKYKDTSYKREIGYIAEDSIFFSWMTIKELLNFNSSFYQGWNNKKAEDFLERFSLDDKTKIRNLSRGMKLKLGLIVALASEPELLILDDPTSGLDVPTRYDFMEDVIREIMKGGTSILFSSHLVHELEGVIEQLGILHSGHLILEEDFQAVKDSAKRIRIAGDPSVLDKIKIEGILTKKTNGNLLELVVYPWEEEKKKKIIMAGLTNFEVKPLTLEEIFISFVS